MNEQDSGVSRRGFGSMDTERQRQIASEGGLARGVRKESTGGGPML